MNIRNLEINELFNTFSYSLSFDVNNVLFITGPNGYGKTTVLDIINAIYANDLDYFLDLPFRSIKVEFENDSLISMLKDKEAVTVTLNDELGDEFYVKRCFKKVNFEHVSNPVYFVYDGSEKIELKQKNNKIENKQEIMEGLNEVFLHGKHAFYVRAQRLQENDVNECKIVQLAKNLSERMLDAALKAGAKSQSLDSSFPNRLFSNLSEFEIYTSSMNTEDRLIGLELRKKEFAKYGLIEKNHEFVLPKHLSSAITSKNKGILDLYIGDALEKLTPYEDLYKKIDLFVSLINAKSLAYKTLKINKKYGFCFVSNEGNEIPLKKLSSGEQNQIIIYYDLIFNTDESSIVLIDEPEISLHVSWQKELWDSIAKIVKINGLSKVIIATHSPQIINQNWEYSCDLFNSSNI